MKRFIKLKLIIVCTILIYNCGSNDDDDCTKTITIPQFYIVNNQTYSYNTTQVVPCDFPEPEDAELIEPPVLGNFSYEVLNFNFTPDTGNNTSRLQFEIKLNNNNDFAVQGIPILTILSDGLEFSGSYSNDASIPCYELNANSNCILTYDNQFSLDLGIVNTFELINVEYYLINI